MYFLEGTINRLSPPTRIGPHNNVLTKQNNQECLRADKEIDKKVQKWKTEEARKIQEEKEKKYWKEHPEDEIKYKQLKSEYDIKLENMNKSQAAKLEAELLVNKCNEAISELNSELIKANAVIEKNQKKIFGKAKCKEFLYQTAVEKIKIGKPHDAFKLLAPISEYKDAQQLIEKCDLMKEEIPVFNTAKGIIKKYHPSVEDLQTALNKFESIQYYTDVSRYIDLCKRMLEVQKVIEPIENNKNKLGFFQLKEKKELQTHIDKLYKAIWDLQLEI